MLKLMFQHRTLFSRVLFIQWALTYVLEIIEEKTETLVIEEVVVSHVGITQGLKDLSVNRCGTLHTEYCISYYPFFKSMLSWQSHSCWVIL